MIELGCSPAYTFARFGEDCDYDNLIWALHRVSELGFSRLQLEVYNKRQFDIFTPDRTGRIRDVYGRLGLRRTVFVAHAIKDDLASLDEEERKEGLRSFGRIVEICRSLECVDVINVATSAPREARLPYRETYPGAPPGYMVVPEGMTWAGLWDRYAATIEECLRLTTRAGMSLAVEPAPGCIVSNTDSFIHLWERFGCREFGMLLDTGHILVQKEQPSVSVEKLGNRLAATHVADNDGMTDDHFPPGSGAVRWADFVSALRKVGYSLPLDIEVNVAKDPDASYCAARDYLGTLLGRG